MKTIYTAMLLFVVLAASVAAADKPAEKPDPALNGTWQVVATQENGKEMPAAEVQKLALELRLTDGRYSVAAGVADIDSGAYQTPAGATPKNIDVSPEKGAHKGKRIPSIYKLEGDDLVICYGFAGTRPKDFATTPGSQLTLIKYARAK